jgi:hypothetical protein
LAILREGIESLCRDTRADGHTLCSARIEFTHVWTRTTDGGTANEIRRCGQWLAFTALFGDLWDPPYALKSRLLPPLPARWLTADVVQLAQGIRTADAFDALPILADALQEAGCDDSLLLEHLQMCPDHTPSCWVVEMILQGASSDAQSQLPPT